jgi:hypothetical protein
VTFLLAPVDPKTELKGLINSRYSTIKKILKRINQSLARVREMLYEEFVGSLFYEYTVRITYIILKIPIPNL